MKTLPQTIGALATGTTSTSGFTVREIAQRYRVSPDRVRGWIANGQLRALNRRDTRSGRPSYVITPESLADFEQGRAVATPEAKPAKRRKRTKQIDFYPD